MEIRELNEGDLESLVKLYEQLDGSNEGFTVESARAVWKSEIEGNKNIKYFGAIEDGKVVSTCFCLIIPNLTRTSLPTRITGDKGLAKKSWKGRSLLPAKETATK